LIPPLGGGGAVNSAHHQAADKVGEGLKVSARAEDGTIEALELKDPKDHPFLLLVQWHPERMAEQTSPLANNLRLKFLNEIKRKKAKESKGRIQFQKSVLKRDLQAYGEDELAERMDELSLEDLELIGALAANYMRKHRLIDAMIVQGAVEFFEGKERELKRKKRIMKFYK
jgi:hypothetical protein